jgi:hypothetical protein
MATPDRVEAAAAARMLAAELIIAPRESEDRLCVKCVETRSRACVAPQHRSICPRLGFAERG